MLYNSFDDSIPSCFIYSLPRASNFKPRRVLQEEPSPWPNTPCRCHIHALLRLAMVQKLETSKCTTMGIPQMHQQMAHKFSHRILPCSRENCHGKYIIFGYTTSLPWILSKDPKPRILNINPSGSRLDVAQVCLVLPDPGIDKVNQVCRYQTTR